MNLEWYWWVLIGVGVVLFIILKVVIGGQWLKKHLGKKDKESKEDF